MPIKKVKGGYKVEGTTTKKSMSKKRAERQLKAIKANQSKKSKKSKGYK